MFITPGAREGRRRIVPGAGIAGAVQAAGINNPNPATLTLDASIMRGWLAGSILSNDGGTPNTKLDVGPGVCVDSNNAFFMKYPALVIDCTTVGALGLDSGALLNSTLYHVYAIGNPQGVTSAIASLNGTTPALPVGFSLSRRLGSFRTDASAHILAFTQTGDEFLLAVSILDVNTSTLGTTSVSFSMSAPPNTDVLFRAIMNINSGQQVIIRSLFENDQAPSGTVAPLATLSQQVASQPMSAGHVRVRLNSSSQLAARASAASITLLISTYGWIDTRGKLL